MTDAVAAGPAEGQREAPRSRPLAALVRAEVLLALAAFAVLCLAVLRATPALVEPDDYAYRASIVAVTDGDPLTLSSAQVSTLAAQLAGDTGPGRHAFGAPGPLGGGIAQWVQLPGGRWISEKDPGYPFLAAPFQWLGIIRLAPLFYGALGCLGLFFGARRWIGHYAGAVAVGLFCSSGAALLFAWRDYMPTFTDASLIAAGTGALLWAMLATEAPPRRRTWIGLLGFLAIEAAVFTRYTDAVVLGCAVLAVLAARWLAAASVPRGALRWWLGSVVLFGAGVAAWDGLIYGGVFKSGYQPGEITFSLNAVGPNLRYLPGHLIRAMPMLVLGLAALAWIVVRWVVLRRSGSKRADRGAANGRDRQAANGRQAGDGRQAAVRDLAVAAALAASWFGVWALYAAYTWTTLPFLSTLQAARFYVPALGAISLLGAWLVTRLPGRAWLAAATSAAVVAVMFGLGIWAYNDMRAFPMGVPGVAYRGASARLPGPARQIGGPPGRRGKPPGGPAIRRS
jgi:hypothetical protein